MQWVQIRCLPRGLAISLNTCYDYCLTAPEPILPPAIFFCLFVFDFYCYSVTVVCLFSPCFLTWKLCGLFFLPKHTILQEQEVVLLGAPFGLFPIDWGNFNFTFELCILVSSELQSHRPQNKSMSSLCFSFIHFKLGLNVLVSYQPPLMKVFIQTMRTLL